MKRAGVASLEMGTAAARQESALENGSLHPKPLCPKEGKKKKGDFLPAWQPGNEFSHHVRAFPLHKVSVSREGRRAELTAGAWGE